MAEKEGFNLMLFKGIEQISKIIQTPCIYLIFEMISYRSS